MPRIAHVALVLAALTVLGTIGYMLIEDWPLLDALYMTVITLTTVGFREVHELSSGGQLFTLGFLVVGLGVFMYGMVTLGEVVVQAQLGQWLDRSKMKAVLKKMNDHYIVCGCGRFGYSLCQQLEARAMPFVIVESNPDVAKTCTDRGWATIIGDATDDTVLSEAGIDRARGIACTLPSDATNLYVVMSARLLHKDLQILSRATTEKSSAKLRRAGADRVISVYETGAAKMAQLLANPRVEDFFEVVSAPGMQMDLAEIEVSGKVPYAGHTLQDSGLRERGLVIVAIRRKNGELLVPPSANDFIDVGDVLIAFGKQTAVQEFVTSSGEREE